MKITRQAHDNTPAKWQGWHILTVGESGFSVLEGYGRFQYGLDIGVIQQFADRINKRNETGTLHPLAPISAVPRHFFRDHPHSRDPEIISDFKKHIGEFIDANRKVIFAQKILVDFFIPDRPSEHYLDATEEVFRTQAQVGPIQEVVIFT